MRAMRGHNHVFLFAVPRRLPVTSVPKQPIPLSAHPANSRRYGCASDGNLARNNQAIRYLLSSGSLDGAVQLFDEMPERNVVSWNLMIAAHARHGFPDRALRLYREMLSLRVDESPTTFCSILGFCSDPRFHNQGLQVHGRVVRLGLEFNFYVASALVNLYMRIGYPEVALRMFAELPEPNAALCNSVLRGLVDLGLVYELVEFFADLNSKGVDVNDVSFSYLLRGCCDGGLVEEGKQLHCQVIKLGLAESNIFVSNALVDLYSAHGSFFDANISFCAIPVEDVICWNSVIAVHAENGYLVEAVEYFYMMQHMGMKSSVRSLVALLNLCGRTKNVQFGVQIHGFGLKSGHVRGSVHVQSALIDMYGKCGRIRKSVLVFDEITEKGTECCNSLITSLLQCNAPEDAIEMFAIMADEGAKPDHVTFSAILRAVSNSAFASLFSCQVLHCRVIKSGLQAEMAVTSSLISAYSKCGHANISEKIFRDAGDPNVVCFTAIIAGYARNGQGKRCLEALNEMVRRGIMSDAVTLLNILAGCDHSGMVEEGRLLFESMAEVYGVTPDQRHYSCMTGLLGRAGLVEEALRLAEGAPWRNTPAMWSSLLHSCRAHGNERVGRRAAEMLMELEPQARATRLQVSGFYSEFMESGGSARARGRNRVSELREGGCSLIEVVGSQKGRAEYFHGGGKW